MPYKIRIEPSGHEFIAHDKESLLEAGLRAGYNLRYQCDNGSCGECKSYLISGETRPLGFSDYTIPESEKSLGAQLLCANQACSDLVIRAKEYDHAADMPYQEITARVKKLVKQQQDIIVLQVRTPRTQTLMFLAGQSARLEIHPQLSQVLEIASCPCNGMLLEFHIRRESGDLFSEYIFNELAVGDEVAVKGPCGEFILDEDSHRPLLFVAYDTGFAAIKSLIEHAVALEMTQEIFLYRIACHPQKNYLHNLCRSWEDALDSFHYKTFDQCIPVGCGDQGKEDINNKFLSSFETSGIKLADCDVYISGIEDMVINLGKMLSKRGLAEGNLFMQLLHT